MAIIYTYPEINQVEGEDLLLISDTSLHKRPTRSVTVDDLALYIGIGFWKLGTAPDSIFTTKMTSVGQDANIANSKFNVYKTEDMVTSVPHVATFNESSSNHSANLWPSPGDNSADIYGSVSRATFTGSGTVDQIIGSNPIGRHSGSGNVNFIQGAQTTASLTGSGSTDAIIASYNKTFIEGTGSNNISTAIGSWNVAELSGLNDVDNIYGTYSNVVLTRGDVNDDAVGHFIDFDQVAVDTEVNNAYYIHAKNDSLSVTGEKFFIKDETGIPSQFSNKLVLNAYGSGTFTGTATQRLAVDTSGNVIEIPIGSGPVDGSGTANYTARWIDTDTLGIGALYDNGTNVGIGTTNPVNKLHVHNGITRLDSGSASSNALGVYSNFSTTAINLFTGSTGSGFISVNNNGMNLGAPWNGGVKVSILNGGNVGIGTTSPGSTLPTDSETASKVLQLTGAGGSTGDTAVLLRSLDNSSGLDLWHNVSSGDSYIDNRYNSNQGDTIFRVKTAGTPLEALRITGNGNVGIGTTSPSAPLHINGGATSEVLKVEATSDPFMRFVENGTNVGFLQFTGGVAYLANMANGDFRFRTNNTDQVIITNTGNVGIGTTAPSEKLEVNGNIRVADEGEIYIQGSTSTRKIVRLDNTNDKGLITLDRSDTTNVSISSDLGTHGHTYFNGLNVNVGIGTTSPVTKLEIKSSSSNSIPFQITNSLDADAIFSILEDGGGDGRARIYNAAGTLNVNLDSSGNSYFNGGNVGVGTTSPGYPLEVNGIIKTSTSFLGTTAIIQKVTALNTNGIQFANNGGSEKMRITDAGNVGIGTTAPTQKLQVDGRIRIPYNSSNSYYFGQDNGSIGYGSMHPFDNGGNYTFDTNYASSVGSYKFKYNGTEIFRLRNTGAFAFGSGGNDYGVSGQILKSNGNASPTWIDGSAIPGVPGGSGTVNTIPLWTPDGDTLGNSIITQPSTSTVDVDGNILISDTGNDKYFGSNVNLILNADADAQSGDSARNIIFQNRGSEKMRIIADGNVGIGTTSPEAKLDVESEILISGTDPILRMERGDGFNSDIIKVESSTDNIIIGDTSLDEMILEVDSGEAVRINGIGNVGIGTTSPSNPLTVVGADSIGIDDYILHNDDGNTKFGFPSNDTFKVRTAGSDRFYINSSGDVGIGTTSPARKLEVYNGSSSMISQFRSGSGTSSFICFANTGSTADQVRIGSISSNLVLSTNYTERIRIDSSGNVGIGTTSPSSKLEIAGTGNQKLLVNRTDGDNFFIDAQNGQIRLRGSSNIYMGVGSDVLTVTNTNVGIGTTSPTKDLEIGTSAAAETEFRMHSDESGRYFNIQSAGNFTSVKTTGSQNFILDSSGSSGYVTFVTNASERMRVNYNGNVGIGTTSPLSKLNVNGDIKIEGENELYFGSSGSVPNWEIKASGSDLVINDTGTNVGSVLFNNDEGIVLPRLTTTEINAISLPNTGLTVYNTTLNTLCFYNGSSWQKVSHTNM